MPSLSHPRFLLVALAGWIHQQQRDVFDYLQEENRVLREQLGPRRLRFTDEQRVRLAAKAKRLPRRVLQEIVSVVSPDTLLAWHRHLIARKVRGPLPARSGPAPGHDGDSATGGADGDGESRVGLHADPGSPGQPGSSRRARNHRQYSQATR